MARHRLKPIEVGTTLQLRVSQNEDQVVLDWLRAQSGSFADAVRFLILMDAKMNGIRDYGEILPRNLSDSFIDRFAETLGNGQNSFVAPTEYVPSTPSGHSTNVVQTGNKRIEQSRSYSSMESNDPEEAQIQKPIVEKQKVAKDGVTEEQLTLEQKKALIEQLKQEVGEAAEEVVREPLNETTNTREPVTDSINREENVTDEQPKKKPKRNSSKGKAKSTEEKNDVNNVETAEQNKEEDQSSKGNNDDPFDLDALAEAWK